MGSSHFGGTLRIGDAPSRKSPDTFGAKISPSFKINFGAIPAALTKGLVSDATSTELPNNTTITYTPATDGTSPLDAASRYAVKTIKHDGVEYPAYDLVVARNVVLTVTHGSSVVAMTCLVTGFDRIDRADGGYELHWMSELLTITATGTSKTATGAKAFRYITSIAFTSAGNSTTNTAAMQPGVKVGVGPYAIATKNDVLAQVDGAHDASATIVAADATSPATTTTGDTRGTVTFASAPNGTLTQALWVTPDPTSKVTLYGVLQA